MLATPRLPLTMASVYRPDTDPQPSSIDYEDSLFPQNAPHPPSGAPLLTAEDQEALSTFFKDMGSDSPAPSGLAGGPMHSESWMDLPPKFMGSTSFYGEHHEGLVGSLTGDFHQLINNASSSFNMPPPPPPSLPTTDEQTQTSGAPSSFDHYTSLVSESAHPSQSSAGVRSSAMDNHRQFSAEVLEAASVLHDGSLHRASFSYGTQPFSRQNTGPAPSSSPAKPRTLTTTLADHEIGLASELGLALEHASLAPPSSLPSVHHTNMFSAMSLLHGDSSQDVPPAASVHRSAPRAELHWGSDQSFNQVQYIPRSAKETTEALESVHLKTMECLEVSRSANTTRPPSPVYGASLHQLNLKTRIASMSAATDVGRKRSVPPPATRLKRRRETASDRGEADDDAGADDEDVAVSGEFGAAGTTTRMGKKWGNVSVNGSNGVSNGSNFLPLSPNSPQQIMPSSSSCSGMSDGTGKRRRLGSSSQAKPPRENLSEEQKRENHIKSEQKRRTLIKEGFDDLCVLVPSLHGGGFSKSVMLSMAADWLEALISGNQQLREQL
ncbi:hlh transcription factor [Grosmannia clavigera kw1407]|uniref:Hlh transcription factor n=1 Tax=Grosmannia clavigera (strain kw1407 / UAMH 11150) TaxID=655863 RepID=F0X7Z5_GROCL|nr:hlh transcription factor [Grosmannia clavigera kw1407]EFX06327.1 hlh transcription factor [Grosmannia clavigera kw1407]